MEDREFVAELYAGEFLENDHAGLVDNHDGREETEIDSHDEQMYVTHNIVDDDDLSLIHIWRCRRPS